VVTSQIKKYLIIFSRLKNSGSGFILYFTKNPAKQIIKIKEKLNMIIAKHTEQPLDKIEKDTDRDFYLSAQEAKEYGIIDQVITNKG